MSLARFASPAHGMNWSPLMNDCDFVIELPGESNLPPNADERTGWESVIFDVEDQP